MDFLMIWLFNISLVPCLVSSQLNDFRIELICIIAPCFFAYGNRLISGHYVINLEIISRFKLLIITIFNRVKEPHSSFLLEA